jgi:hypothetical protein
MKAVAIVLLERNGMLVPLCRTRRPEAVEVVVLAALEDVKAAARNESDEEMKALMMQEAERLKKGLITLRPGNLTDLTDIEEDLSGND